MKVKALGGGRFHIRDSVYNPEDPINPHKINRIVGPGTKYETYRNRNGRVTTVQNLADAKRLGQQWRDELSSGQGSLTFGKLKAKYIADVQPKPNIVRVLNSTMRALDDAILSEIKTRLQEFIKSESARTIKRTMMNSDGEWVIGERHLSPNTLKFYTRYTKSILSHSGYGDLLSEIKVGRSGRRTRPITHEEMEKIEAEILKLDPKKEWLWVAFEFARKNPIRPEDQFALRRGENLTDVPFEINYVNMKTMTAAHPVMLPEFKDLLKKVIDSDLVFPGLNGQCMYPHEQNPVYYRVFKRVCANAGCPDVVWYDLRHNAVSYLRSKGVEDWRIQKAAGWTTMDMINEYDTDNKDHIRDYDRNLDKIIKASEPEQERKAV
jgi:hypothetical protein